MFCRERGKEKLGEVGCQSVTARWKDRTQPGAFGKITRGGEDRECSSMNVAPRDRLGGEEPRTTTHPGLVFHYLSPHTLPSRLLPAMLELGLPIGCNRC